VGIYEEEDFIDASSLWWLGCSPASSATSSGRSSPAIKGNDKVIDIHDDYDDNNNNDYDDDNDDGDDLVELSTVV